MTTSCGGSSARALAIHTRQVRPRDRRDERQCGPRLHHHRGRLLHGRLDASTTKVSFLESPTSRLPPLPRLELLAVLLPISSTALPCSLFPALDDCVGLTYLRSRCAQDRWQLEIGAANGGVEGRFEAVARTSPSTCSEALVPWHDRRNAFLSSSWQVVRAPVAREPLHITLCLLPRLMRLSRSLVSSLWSRIARAYESLRALR